MTRHNDRYVPTPHPNPVWPDLDHNHTHFFFVTSKMSEDAAATIRLWKDVEDAMKEKVFYYDQIKQWYKRFTSNGTQSATYNVITAGYFCKHKIRMCSHISTTRLAKWAAGYSRAKGCNDPGCVPPKCRVVNGQRPHYIDGLGPKHTLLLNATRFPLTDTVRSSTFKPGSAKIWKSGKKGAELEIVGEFRDWPGSPVDILHGKGKRKGEPLKGVVIQVRRNEGKADVCLSTKEGKLDRTKMHSYNLDDLRIRSFFEVESVKPWEADRVRETARADEAGIMIEHTGSYAAGFLEAYAPRYAALSSGSRGLAQRIGNREELRIFKDEPKWESCPEITLLNGFLFSNDEVQMEYDAQQVYGSNVNNDGSYPTSSSAPTLRAP